MDEFPGKLAIFWQNFPKTWPRGSEGGGVLQILKTQGRYFRNFRSQRGILAIPFDCRCPPLPTLDLLRSTIPKRI